MSLLGNTYTKQDIVNAILNQAQKEKQVIYGARSVNIQLPKHLNKETKDYDILTNKPELSAKRLVTELNKKFGKEKFKVEQAKHLQTFKVKNTETGETIADYTGTTKKPKSYNNLGVRYAELNYQKNKIRQSLRSEANSFRHDKDRETLNRIKQGEKKW